jgi:hypothetical protein
LNGSVQAQCACHPTRRDTRLIAALFETIEVRARSRKKKRAPRCPPNVIQMTRRTVGAALVQPCHSAPHATGAATSLINRCEIPRTRGGTRQTPERFPRRTGSAWRSAARLLCHDTRCTQACPVRFAAGSHGGPSRRRCHRVRATSSRGLCQLVETEAERRQEKASLRTRRTDFG